MIDGLEQLCDDFNADLPELRSFVLPGGTEASARLHVARTICRRAERDVLLGAQEVDLNPLVLRYLNRLSDLLFILARAANAEDASSRGSRSGGGLASSRATRSPARSSVAGYVGSMLGLVLGTLRLPLRGRAHGEPARRRRDEHRDLGRLGGSGRDPPRTRAPRRLAHRRVDGAAVGRGRDPRRAASPTTSRSGCSTPRSPQCSSGAGSTSPSGRCGRERANGSGSGPLSPAGSASARSAAPSASSSARCGCRRSSAPSGWTSSARPGRTSSSASSSVSPASRARGRSRRRLADPARRARGGDPRRLARRAGDRTVRRERCGWRSARARGRRLAFACRPWSSGRRRARSPARAAGGHVARECERAPARTARGGPARVRSRSAHLGKTARRSATKRMP